MSVMKFLQEVTTSFLERHGRPPHYIDYDIDPENKRTFVLTHDYDHPDMKYQSIAFWELEDSEFLDHAVHKRMDLYYYPLCPQHVTLRDQTYTFTGAVVYNNVIYAEFGRIKNNDIERIVISRSYDEEYMKELEERFNQLEWQAIEREQAEEEEAILEDM